MATRGHTGPGPKYVKHSKNTKLVAEYNITHPEDINHFQLKACIHIPDCGYVMIDKANKNIKLVDSNFRCIDVLKLSSCPFDLCVSTRNKAEFYATEPDTQQVHNIVFEKTGKMKVKKSMDIGEDCRGITCWKSGLAVAVMREGFKGTLGLMDYKGSIKKKVWQTEIHTDLFKAPWYLASIKDGTEIVISDQGYHSVICLDAKTLTTIFIFHDATLIGPRSLCVDSRDNIYVIGSSEACHNVVKLSPEGKLSGVPLSRTDRLNFPSGIGYNIKDDTIILQTNRDRPAVSVYYL